MPGERGTRTAVCRHTGVAIPECSCKECVERQIALFMPNSPVGDRPHPDRPLLPGDSSADSRRAA